VNVAKKTLGFVGRLLACCVVLVLTGCAATGNVADPRDPLEGLNRAVYSLNEGIDETVMKPVATTYRGVVPEFARVGVRNFFSNVEDLYIGFNNLLQGKPGDTVSDWSRVLVNSTVGVFGLIDWASDMGLDKHNEDFGQTFGRWGVGDGAYVIWPLLGPATVRDSFGRAIDIYVDPIMRYTPVPTRNTLLVTNMVSLRANLLDASRILEEAALDKYVFERDAYLQRRRNLIYDGTPPRTEPAQ
jgi:phospholipid-binding lipoprotein MlaA